MSATLEDNVVDILPIKPEIMSFDVKGFGVETVFDEESSDYKAGSEERYLRAAELVGSYHKQRALEETFLVFVPGKQEIDTVCETIQKLIPEEEYVLYQAHGELYSEELLKIHEKAPVGVRKIVVATNVVECSITIEDVAVVIDTLTSRMASSDSDSLCLELGWVSQSSSDQRRGRTGRTCKGLYVYMQNERFYHDLPKHYPPELTRMFIGYLVLQLIKNGFDPKIVLAPIVDQHRVSTNLDLLIRLNFIKITDEETDSIKETCLDSQKTKMEVTEMGDFCSKFPLGIRLASMIYWLINLEKLKNLSENHKFIFMAVICTLNCYGSGLIRFPRRIKGEDNLSYSIRKNMVVDEFKEIFRGKSSLDTILNIWILLCSEINPFSYHKLANFCFKYHISSKKFNEIIQILKQCSHRAWDLGFLIKRDFKKFDFEENLAPTFDQILSLTHIDLKGELSSARRKQWIFACGQTDYMINRNSSFKLDPDESYECYALIRSESRGNNGRLLRFINVFHVSAIIPKPEPESDSDSDSDSRSEISKVPLEHRLMIADSSKDVFVNEISNEL